ncbi:MAG: serine kinase, partial [Mesorhizobium sp.]
MTRPCVYYDLNGQVLGISAERAELWLDFDRMLAGLRVEGSTEADFRFDIAGAEALD